MGLRDLFGPKPLAIKGPVGPTAPNRRADVGKVETFLSRTDNHDLTPTDGPTGYYGLRLEDSINAFQKANGLKSDGLLNPRGKTLRTLTGKLRDQLNLPTPKITGPLPLPGQGANGSAGASAKHAQIKHPGNFGGSSSKAPGPTTGPQIAQSTLPPAVKDPLEEFKGADRASMRPFIKLNADLDRIEENFKGIEDRGKKGGFPVASKMMRHFRVGDGKTVPIERDWLRKQEAIRVSERRVQGHFKNWITGKQLPDPKAPSEKIIEALLTLKDGGKLNRDSKWEALVEVPFIDKLNSDFFYAVGGSNIKSKGSFRFVRRGNKILVVGRVDHRWFNRYHWKKGEAAFLPSLRRFRHDDALKLQKHRGAKPFDMVSKWSQTVTGTISIRVDKKTGRLVITGVELKWIDPEVGRVPQ